MESILVLTHTKPEGSLAQPTLEVISSANALTSALPGSKWMVGLIGASTQATANQIANSGAARFLAVTGPEFAHSRYATDAAAVAALCQATGATIVLAPANSRLNRVLPGVAQRLNGRADTHVTGLAVDNGTVSASRWYYRQRMEAVLRCSRRPWFLLLEPGSQRPWAGAAGSAQVEEIAVPITDAMRRTTVIGLKQPAAEAQTIRPDAKLLFVAGAGWTKKQADGQPHTEDAEKLILGYLKLAQASLGSSKSLVDLSGEGQAVLPFLTHLNQIGQTGATPRHPKGLATCCHGEEPHTVGWRFISERRAINLDPNCGWARGKADVLYVADAFAVMTKVNALLGSASA